MNIYIECNSNILSVTEKAFYQFIVILIIIIKMFLYGLILFYYLVYLLKWNEHFHDIFFYYLNVHMHVMQILHVYHI